MQHLETDVVCFWIKDAWDDIPKEMLKLLKNMGLRASLMVQKMILSRKKMNREMMKKSIMGLIEKAEKKTTETAKKNKMTLLWNVILIGNLCVPIRKSW